MDKDLSKRFFPKRFLLSHASILICIAAAELAFPLLLMKAIDAIVGPANALRPGMTLVVTIAAMMAGLVVAQFMLRYRMSIKLAEHVHTQASDLRLNCLERTTRRYAGLLSEKKISHLLQHLQRDIGDIQDSLLALLSEIPIDILTIVGVVIASFVINPIFGAVFSGLTLLACGGLWAWHRRGAGLYARVLEENQHLLEKLNEYIRSSSLFSSQSARADASTVEIKERSAQLLVAQRERQKLNAVLAPFFGLSEYIGIVLVLLVGGYAASHGTLSPGALVAYFAFVEMVAEPLHRINVWQDSAQKFSAAWGRLTEQEGTDNDHHNIVIKAAPEKIRFDRVSIAHPETGALILHNISFTISRGERVAVIGVSGSGKSTLLEALVGFRRPSEGSILIDGCRLDRIDRESWRSQLASWPQDTLVLERSVEVNITLENTTHDPSRLRRVLQQTGLDDRLKREPLGLQTLCGLDGVRLSGGERQRLALARLLYRDSSIVLLDEPTSALDVQSERELLSILKAFVQDKTCLIVSHRSSLLELATRVLILEGGRVIGGCAVEDAWETFPAYREFFSSSWATPRALDPSCLLESTI